MASKSPSIAELQSARALSASDLDSISRHSALLSVAERAELEATIRLDVQSEFDAGFLAQHLAQQSWDLSEPLKAALDQRLVDEELHQALFLQVYEAAFPDLAGELGENLARRDQDVSFEPLKPLMGNEFEVLCLLAYDELTTVKAYQSLLAQYRRLGPSMTPLLRLVIRDEGHHYATFARILRTHHADRIGEAAAQIEKIRANEGAPYANTFVLDHDYGIWTDPIFDRSAAQLKRALGLVRNSA